MRAPSIPPAIRYFELVKKRFHDYHPRVFWHRHEDIFTSHAEVTFRHRRCGLAKCLTVFIIQLMNGGIPRQDVNQIWHADAHQLDSRRCSKYADICPLHPKGDLGYPLSSASLGLDLGEVTIARV